MMHARVPRLWFLPIVDTVGPLRVGIVAASGLLLVNLTAGLFLGCSEPLKIRFAIYLPLAVGYSFAVWPTLVSRLHAEVEGIQGFDRLGTLAQGVATAAGVAISTTLALLSPQVPDTFRWILGGENLLLWIVIAPIVAVLGRAVWRLRRLGQRARVNLLDLRSLAVFGRAAGLVASSNAGLLVIFTLLTIVGREGGARAELPSVIGVTIIIAAALYLPVSGARRAIGAAKQAELERVAKALGDHRDVLGDAGGPDRVDRLLAYRERIQSVPEWPFAVGAGPRALLYVALPLLSWIAAAFVERSLDVFLG